MIIGPASNYGLIIPKASYINTLVRCRGQKNHYKIPSQSGIIWYKACMFNDEEIQK